MLLASILQQAIPMHSKQEGREMSFVSFLITVLGLKRKADLLCPRNKVAAGLISRPCRYADDHVLYNLI